jgi:hypothetical protein
MSEPREVVVTFADARRLTVLEVARACRLADVRQADVKTMLAALDTDVGASPEDVERGATLLYAIAFELHLRDEPGLTWADAQRWRVILDLTTRDELAEAEAEARVDAAIVTGLPLDRAGEVTVAELEAYRTAHDRRAAGEG